MEFPHTEASTEALALATKVYEALQATKEDGYKDRYLWIRRETFTGFPQRPPIIAVVLLVPHLDGWGRTDYTRETVLAASEATVQTFRTGRWLDYLRWLAGRIDTIREERARLEARSSELIAEAEAAARERLRRVAFAPIDDQQYFSTWEHLVEAYPISMGTANALT